MTMKLHNRLLQVAVTLVAVTCFASVAAAQSSWKFSKKYTPKFEQTWTRDHVIHATHCGEGTMTAVDADGKPLGKYEVIKNRPVAGPFKAGCAYVFEVPSGDAAAGDYIDFNATFSIEDGAPMNWVLEIMDGGVWKEGRRFRCHGPGFGSDYIYTSAYHTFRLENAPKGETIVIRLRAAEGEVRPVREGKENEATVMFIPATYVGVKISDFGSACPKDTTRVLCIGNSFTYYHGTPVMLKELAWNEGHYLDISASLKGGWTMAKHSVLPLTEELIAEGAYEYVFLQDQSQAPAKVGKDRKEHAQLVKDMAELADKVRTTSPGCKAMVECTWAYPAKDGGGFGSYEAFYAYAKKGAKIMAKAVGKSKISPIADAFDVVRNERPDINLYHTDNYHQSPEGSYLKSCVNYLMLFGTPFSEKAADCQLDKDIARYLRSVAERVVLK